MYQRTGQHVMSGSPHCNFKEWCRILVFSPCFTMDLSGQNQFLISEVMTVTTSLTFAVTTHMIFGIALTFLPHLVPFPFLERVGGLKGTTHLPLVHAVYLGLAEWVSTRAPHQLSSNKTQSAAFRLLTCSRFRRWKLDISNKKPNASEVERMFHPP